jgi:ribosomal protein S8
MYVGQKYKLKANGFKGKVKWKSSNKKIATVNKKGKITAKKKGKVKIIAKYKKTKRVCKVTIVSKKEYKKIMNKKKSNPESSVAPVATTAPQITTIPATTTEEETTTVPETTTEEEEEFDINKYVEKGIVFYDSVITCPKSDGSVTVYQLLDVDRAWKTYRRLRGQFVPLSQILSELQNLRYVSGNPSTSGVPEGEECRKEFLAFSHSTMILTHTDEEGYVRTYQIVDFENAWKLFNTVLAMDKDPDFEFNSNKIVSQLKAKGYVK